MNYTLRNTNVNCRAHKSPLLDPIQFIYSNFSTFWSFLPLSSHLCIEFPSRLCLRMLQIKFVSISYHFHVAHFLLISPRMITHFTLNMFLHKELTKKSFTVLKFVSPYIIIQFK